MKLYSTRDRYMKRWRKRFARIAVLAALIITDCVLGIVAIGGILRDYSRQGEFNDLSENVHAIEHVIAFEHAIASEEIPHDVINITEQPEEDHELEILTQYAELYEQNPDLFGWIQIEDTILDYPVMHTPDEPEKYLHLSFEDEASTSGTPFMDAKCSMDSDNYIIYGHNMKNGTMFREISKYKDKAYWQEHPVIRFDTLYEQGEYEVLAAFYDRVYYANEDCFKFYRFIDAMDEVDYDNAIQNYKEKSLYDTGVSAEYGDRLITLVTCAYHVENGRFVVVARQR